MMKILNIIDVFHKIIIFHPFNYVEKQWNKMMKPLSKATSNNSKNLNNKIMTHNNQCWAATTNELKIINYNEIELTRSH